MDDFSRFSWFYPLKLKSDFYDVFRAFLTFVQTQFSCKLKAFQTDGGTEFMNHRVRDLLISNGTNHRVSCPHTLQQNGRAKRKHRHLTETGLAMLFNASAHASYWVDSFSTAAYIINRIPSKLLDNKSPYELLYHASPNYSLLRTFGCRVFLYLRDYSQHKLAPRSSPCVFIGYDSHYKGYRCLDLASNRVYTTRHAIFDEAVFPFRDTSQSSLTHVFAKSRGCPIPHITPDIHSCVACS